LAKHLENEPKPAAPLCAKQQSVMEVKERKKSIEQIIEKEVKSEK
jgi:hypothetical protein